MESAESISRISGEIRGFEAAANAPDAPDASDASDASAALDRFNQGVAIVDRLRRVRYVNSFARTICSESGVLRICHGILVATEPRHVRPLTQACEQAVLAGRETLLRLDRTAPRETLSVLVSALPPRLGSPASGSPPTAGLAMLTLNDPQRRSPPSIARLMKFYGLTPTEAAVTQLLLAGRTPAALARELGMSVATARTHLRCILSKTDTHRQADLVQRVQQEAAVIL